MDRFSRTSARKGVRSNLVAPPSRWELSAAGAVSGPPAAAANPPPPELPPALEKLEPSFPPPDEFRDVSRGKPIPHTLPEAKRREVGLTRDTWRLEVVSDPEHPATLGQQFTRAAGTALTFDDLLRL